MTRAVLFPGELACRRLDVEGEDNRLILRMWSNTLVWGLLATIVAALVAV